MKFYALLTMVSLGLLITHNPIAADTIDLSQTPEAEPPVVSNDYVGIWDANGGSNWFNLGQADRKLDATVFSDWSDRYPYARICENPAQDVRSPPNNLTGVDFNDSYSTMPGMVEWGFDIETWSSGWGWGGYDTPPTATALIAPMPGIYRFRGQIDMDIVAALEPEEEKHFTYALYAMGGRYAVNNTDTDNHTFQSYNAGTRTLHVQGAIRLQAGDPLFLMVFHSRGDDPNRPGSPDADEFWMATKLDSGMLEMQRIAD